MPPIFWMSSVASSLHHVDDVVDGHDALHAPPASTTGMAIRSCWRDQRRPPPDPCPRRTVTRSVCITSRTLALPGALEQVAERDHAEQLVAVEHVGVVDRLEVLARLAAHVADRLVDRHLGAHARVARVHQAAGLVLRVGEQRAHLAARGVVEAADQLGRAAPRAPAGSGRRRRRAAAGAVQSRRSAGAIDCKRSSWSCGRQRVEELFGLVRRHQPEAVDALAGVEDAPHVAQLGRREALGPTFELLAAMVGSPRAQAACGSATAITRHRPCRRPPPPPPSRGSSRARPPRSASAGSRPRPRR